MKLTDSSGMQGDNKAGRNVIRQCRAEFRADIIKTL
jgi:hypothetical protein